MAKIFDRLKYHQVNPKPDALELVETSYNPSSFRANSDTATLITGANPIQYDGDSQRSLEPPPGYPFRKSWRKPGWRVGASLAAGTAALALLINIITAIAVSKSKGIHDGMATIYTGSCSKTESMNTWIHLAINAMSTFLLSGSNYCMQCLVAPTRDDIDKAHAKRKWLDIGVPSVRNLTKVSQKKHLLWWCLGLSSVPLHLLYNSVFFSAIATTNYNFLYVTEGFATGTPFNHTRWPNAPGFDGVAVQKAASKWENLTNSECIQVYGNDFISKRRTVLVVVDSPDIAGPEGKGSIIDISPYNFNDGTNGAYDPYSWLCESSDYFNNPCFRQLPGIEKNVDNDGWTTGGHKAKYCLSERIDESCSLHFSLPLILVVIVCNLGKLLAMSTVVLWLRSSSPLMTVGDTIDSFLRTPDRFTKGMCLASWETFSEMDSRNLAGDSNAPIFKPQRRRWARAASPLRWITWTVMFIIAMVIVVILLAYGISGLKGDKDAASLWSLGFGGVHAESIITGWTLPQSEAGGLASAVLIANMPQPILSFLYLLFNGLCTCMLLAKEWGSYGYERKPLRVSDPRGQQRSTYFLQLPYKYAIPLVITSGILHWLVSQSIFLAYVTVLDQSGTVLTDSGVVSCGYSPMAIIFTVIVGGCLLSFALFLGLQRLNPDMPIVASCSAAIAASCHGLPRDTDAPFHPIQWGVVEAEKLGPDDVGHCCFTSEPVTVPIPGRKYAGMMEEDMGGKSSGVERQ